MKKLRINPMVVDDEFVEIYRVIKCIEKAKNNGRIIDS